MAHQDLSIGSFRYDTTQALFDGDVGIEGAHVQLRTAATIPEIFQRVLTDEEFDISELGMTFYLRTFTPDSAYVAIPVFPNRVFRHSSIFVNTNSGIEHPSDIVGKRIGEFGMYSQDSGIWAKGILMDEHGFRPETNTWVIGGLNEPAEPFGFVPRAHPAGVDIETAPEGASLGTMLHRGGIDVLFSANIPQAMIEGSPNIKLLFADYEPVERDYFSRTGIFPMMHAIVIRRELVREDPTLARRVYEAFAASKEAAADRYRYMRRLYQVQSMLPWTNALFERNLANLPDDWWPYGVAGNRAAIEANLRYHFEQGITERHYALEEVFEGSLLDT